MKFTDRKTELKLLNATRKMSESKSSQMTVVVGRRRIGKTRLIIESLKKEKYLYFFVARKDERLLCEEFSEQIRATLGLNVYGEITRFPDIFGLLLDYTEREPLTLVIDEFQEFNRINPAVYSEIQDLWDRKKDRTKMNLILSGSVYSLMKKIFESNKEPLFGRANERLYVRPFTVDTLKTIISEYNPHYGASKK